MAEPSGRQPHIDLLKIPERLRSSGDPIEENPFQDDDPRYSVWADATQRAKQELRLLNSAMVGALNGVQPRTPEESCQAIIGYLDKLVTGKYDIWAKRAVHIVWDEAEEQTFARWLERYANVWLNEIAHFFPRETGNIDWLLKELRTRLISRMEYWKSEASRYLNQQAEFRKVCDLSPAQAWKSIQPDYVLRHSLVADDWAKEHLAAKNAVLHESMRKNNSGYLGSAWVDMEISDIDRRAEWAFRTCQEIWDLQGRMKCRPFFRAVFDECLQPMFSIREGCFQSELELYQTRTGKQSAPELSATLGAMKRQMDALRAKWNTKLEIESRNIETRERLSESREVSRIQVPGGSSSTLNRPQMGRKPKRSLDFIAFVENFWRQRKGHRRYVSLADLKAIADEMDLREFTPPADYLEAKAAKELRARNSRNSNSKNGGPILTWRVLVEREDKDDLTAMRRLLRRYVSK